MLTRDKIFPICPTALASSVLRQGFFSIWEIHRHSCGAWTA